MHIYSPAYIWTHVSCLYIFRNKYQYTISGQSPYLCRGAYLLSLFKNSSNILPLFCPSIYLSLLGNSTDYTHTVTYLIPTKQLSFEHMSHYSYVPAPCPYSLYSQTPQKSGLLSLATISLSIFSSIYFNHASTTTSLPFQCHQWATHCQI